MGANMRGQTQAAWQERLDNLRAVIGPENVEPYIESIEEWTNESVLNRWQMIECILVFAQAGWSWDQMCRMLAKGRADSLLLWHGRPEHAAQKIADVVNRFDLFGRT